MKFFQVHNFYPDALEALYQRSPGLENLPSHKQVEAVIRDGSVALHVFAPYLGKLGYQSGLIVANNARAQVQWLKEHPEYIRSQKMDMVDVVRAQLNHYQPEVLYLSEPIQFEGHFLKSLAYKPKLVLGWRGSIIPENISWDGIDIILSNFPGVLEVAPSLGAKKAIHFKPGFPEWIAEEVQDIEPECDVLFCGQVFPRIHDRRAEYLDYLAREIESCKFSGEFYISGRPDLITPSMQAINRGSRFGLEMHRTLRKGRIVVDVRGGLALTNQSGDWTVDLVGKKPSANMRTFEATGSGCFLLVEHENYVDEYFEPGVEIETYRTKGEMIEKIEYYLAHPEEREAIARRGQERCLREHAMSLRSAEFGKIIEEHLSGALL